MWVTGVILTVFALIIIVGGIQNISKVSSVVVPLMAIFYILCAIVVLVIKVDKIPQAFALIFKEAFNFRAAAGGTAGYGIMLAMHYGFSRGVFSNEAGLGSAAISAAAEGVGARRSAAKSHMVKSVSWPTAEIVGIGDSNKNLASISSLKADRSSEEPPPRPIIIKSASLL